MGFRREPIAAREVAAEHAKPGAEDLELAMELVGLSSDTLVDRDSWIWRMAVDLANALAESRRGGAVAMRERAAARACEVSHGHYGSIAAAAIRALPIDGGESVSKKSALATPIIDAVFEAVKESLGRPPFPPAVDVVLRIVCPKEPPVAWVRAMKAARKYRLPAWMDDAGMRDEWQAQPLWVELWGEAGE